MTAKIKINQVHLVSIRAWRRTIRAPMTGEDDRDPDRVQTARAVARDERDRVLSRLAELRKEPPA